MSPAQNAAIPRISVIIASIVGPPFIDDCLASILGQKGAPPFEVVVADCRGPDHVARLQSTFPAIRVIPVERRESVPQLRCIAAEHARGSVVAVIEEHCIAAENWLANLAAAFTPEYRVAGGPVDFRDDGRLRDWVTYFIEYNAYLPPCQNGETTQIGSANIAYGRDALIAHVSVLGEGYWEAVLHPLLLAEGAKFRGVPGMVVYHRGPFDYVYYLRQRYLFSRAFAGARRGTVSGAKRAIYCLAAPLIPFVLLGRIGMRVLAKRCHTSRFILCLPLILPALAGYVAGEWMGYLFGPGRALLEVE